MGPEIITSPSKDSRQKRAPNRDDESPTSSALSTEVRALAKELRSAGRVLTTELQTACQAVQGMQKSAMARNAIPALPPALMSLDVGPANPFLDNGSMWRAS